LADFFSVDLKLAKPSVMAWLTVLLVLSVAAAWQLVWRNSVDRPDAQSNLLRADSGYWVAMLTAGTLGTVLGDYFSHDLHFGHVGASVALSALLAPFFIAGVRQLLWPLPVYWATIVMIRAAGTAVGDVLAERNNLGLALSTAVTGLVFVAFLISWRSARGGAATVSVN
jgi:uncharacterized membrane-anchored protein